MFGKGPDSLAKMKAKLVIFINHGLVSKRQEYLWCITCVMGKFLLEYIGKAPRLKTRCLSLTLKNLEKFLIVLIFHSRNNINYFQTIVCTMTTNIYFPYCVGVGGKGGRPFTRHFGYKIYIFPPKFLVVVILLSWNLSLSYGINNRRYPLCLV